MAITLIRRSERIRNRNRAAANSRSMLHIQTKRQGAGTSISSSHCKRNNKIRRLNRATSPISTLPDDLVIEVLSRLPSKPFFRCRTVCKSWLYLSFDALRLNEHLRPTLGGIFYNKFCFGAGFVNLSRGADKVEIDSTISALSSYDRFRIIDCCNGLLLIEAFNKNAPSINDLYVYNPATRTVLTVWSFTTPVGHYIYYQTFSLAFDPRVHSQFHIICFTSWIDNGEMFSFLDIFLFEKGKCTTQKELSCDPIISFCSKGTFIEGKVYHVTTKNKILSIDPKKCSYEVIHPPDMKNRTLVEIGQTQGFLHCLSFCEKKPLLSIWVLKSYTRQEWTLKHQLNLREINSVLQPRCDASLIFYRMRFMGHFVLHPEKDIMLMPVGRDDFVALELSTGKRSKKLGKLGDRLASGFWVYVPCYLV